MATTIDNKPNIYARPAARFDEDGNLEIRASAAGNCRRALWYAATGYEITNPPTEESLTVMEAGNALEPVVLRAMERAGWEVAPVDPQDPQPVSVQLGPRHAGDGPPRRHGRHAPLRRRGGHRGEDQGAGGVTSDGGSLGAERSHPASVAQAAIYTYGTFGEARDAVIAAMDTGSSAVGLRGHPRRAGGTQTLERALRSRLGELAEHHALHGPGPDALPDRDFSAGDWQCASCPFLNGLPARGCRRRRRPGRTEPRRVEGEEVSDEEAREAAAIYAAAQEALKAPEQAKRRALDALKAWMRQAGDGEGDPRSRGRSQEGQPGADHPLRGGLQEVEQPAGPGDPRRDRHRAGIRVRAGQLTTLPPRERNTGPLSSPGGGPASAFNRARPCRAHNIQEEPKWHGPSTR